MEFWDKIWDALKVKNHYSRFTTTGNLSILEKRLKYVVESQQKIEQERKRKVKIHQKVDMMENSEDPEKESYSRSSEIHEEMNFQSRKRTDFLDQDRT